MFIIQIKISIIRALKDAAAVIHESPSALQVHKNDLPDGKY